MTQEQATQLEEDLNDILTESDNTDLTYSVYTYWTAQAVKEYNVILYPAVYKADYESFDTSGQFAVVRVSIKTQSIGAQSQEDFVSNFNAEVAKDAELSELLKK